MKNGFWKLLWSSFQSVVLSWEGFSVGFAFAFVSWKIPPNTPIPVYWLVLVLIVSTLVMAISLKAANTAFEEYQKLRRRNIPSILFVQKENNSDAIICLLEYSEIFAHDMMVSAYYTNKDDIEVLIATGFVKNIQDNRKIVVQLSKLEHGQEEILKKIANNDKSIIDRTIIKPGISKTIFNKLLFDTQFN